MHGRVNLEHPLLLGLQAHQVLFRGQEGFRLMLSPQFDQFGDIGMGVSVMIAPGADCYDGDSARPQSGEEFLLPGDRTEGDDPLDSGISSSAPSTTAAG